MSKEETLKYGWLTDIHLEFMKDRLASRFVKGLAAEELDGLFLTGDISTAKRLEFHLQLFEDLYQGSVYFVLGNHDYYGGDIGNVRNMVEEICYKSSYLHWLPALGVVELNNNTCLIGHGSWADGRLGDYTPQGGTEKSGGSRILLNDYVKIQNFVKAGSHGRLILLNSLGDQSAAYFETILPEALAQYKHIILLTHIPPFKESCWHEGEISDDDWLPHFSCKAVGDVLVKCMKSRPDQQMTVLCGHTHSSGMAEILPNLQVKTGGAEYGSPAIQEIMELMR